MADKYLIRWRTGKFDHTIKRLSHKEVFISVLCQAFGRQLPSAMRRLGQLSKLGLDIQADMKTDHMNL